MLREEREVQIMELARRHRFCGVRQLSEALGASQATVRRDLQQLAAAGRLRLTRGGATLAGQSVSQEPAYDEKLNLRLSEKQRIGRAAAARVRTGETILLDTGTTVLQMCAPLRESRGVTCATNDIRVASELARAPDLTLHMLGGAVRKGHYTALGGWALRAIAELHADTFFMSCDAIDLARGLTITNSEEVALKRAMLDAADRCVLLCDHAKFQTIAFLRLCGVERVQTIITGADLDPDCAARYRDAGVEVETV